MRTRAAAGARARRPQGADPKITERVRALLAKAESTTFPDEAEAFTAKAQELIAQHAIDGWPSVPADGWDALRLRCLRSIEEAERIAAESDSLGDRLLPPDVHIPSLAKESRGSGILHAAVHSSHHLGQIITMRQLMGLWPPPGGTITW